MKILYAFLFAAFFLVTVAGASASLTNNLLLYYANDNAGSFSDSLGVYSGTTNGSTYNATGKINGAYNFPITGGFVNVSDRVDLRLVGTSYAINFWIYPQSVPSPTIGRIINKDDAADFSGGYGIYTNNLNLSWTHNTGADNNWITTYRFTEDNWVMVTAVYDTVSNQRYLYINGTLHSNRTTTSDVATETDTFFINGWGPGPASAPGQYGNFVIDEVGIWNRSLTSGEVTQLYNSFSGLAYPFGTTGLSITASDAYNGTAVQSFNATVTWNGTTTTWTTTNGSVQTNATVYSWLPANVTVTPSQNNYFALPQTFTNYNTTTLAFNATPLTLVRVYAFNGTLINNFSANWSGPSYNGSGSTTNGTLYVPIYNGTYEVTVYGASLGGFNYAVDSENLTGSLYLRAYNFTLYKEGTVFFNIRNAETNSLINVSTNISLNGLSGSYVFSTSNGTYFADGTINEGTYYVTISATGFEINKAVITSAGDYQNVTFYVDSGTFERLFQVRNTFGLPINNATITFSRNVNGSVVVYSQTITDLSGLISVYLDTSVLYLITGIEPSGTYSDYTGSVLPSVDQTYFITFSFSSSNQYSDALNDTYYSISANYDNTTSQIVVDWEVIGANGDIEYFGMTTSYDGNTYSDNSSGVPGGGISTITINGVDLTVQDTINVVYFYKRINYEIESFSNSFYFINTDPKNSSITGGMFGGDNVPQTIPFKALLGMIIVIIVTAAVYSTTKMTDMAGIAAISTVGILTLPSVGVFPLLYGVITVVVGAMVLLVKVLRGA